MVVTIITDCFDENAKGRQITRAGLLFGSPISFIGVDSGLEASGNLIDNLDALKGEEGVILVNVSRRDGEAKQWKNGPPFSYFWYKKTLVVASINDLTLSLVKKLTLVKSINVMDIPIVINRLIEKKYISTELKEDVIDTQFRSFNFLPYVAKFLFEYKEIKSEILDMTEIPDAPDAIWAIDNFGNCKTTVLENEDTSKNNKSLAKIAELPFYNRLKDVPNNEAALIVGSSGIENSRFLEIVIQGGNAAKHFKLSNGDLI